MDTYIHPSRTMPRFRPLKALGHMKKLIADNDDIEQVFHITECLNGNQIVKALDAFAAHPAGRARMAERLDLPAYFDDRAAVRALPAGSVGRAYLEFMEREGLTAGGLVEQMDKWRTKDNRYQDDIEYLSCRMRDTHDLMHVLSGYGRDQLGEVSVLAFTHEQNGGTGSLFIAYMGGRDLKKRAPKQARIFDAIREARDIGRNSSQILLEHIPTLMAEPLQAARARLGLREPLAYKHALRVLSETGYVGEFSAQYA